MSKKSRKRDEDDGVFDEDDDDDAESVDRSVGKAAVSKKRKKQSFIDDAAEESGDDAADNEDDEEDDDDNNDYVKDDFVVDEEDEGVTKKKDDLEDSDDEISDEENDDAHLKKIKKVRVTDRLDEDDLALINEARGISAVDLEDDDILEVAVPVEKPRKRVVATTEEELQKGLFYDSGDEVDEQEQREEASKDKAQRKPMRVERYDEDGMDDFIEDDIGDQDAIRMSDRKNYDDEDARDISEAQLNEASEIFGTDYLEFMQDDGEEEDEEEEELLGKSKYRERGVGVQYEMDSEEDEVLSEDDDDDLFGEDDDDALDGGTSAQQKAEALRLKREKRKLAKAERRRQAELKKSRRRKAQLRKAFEPVQLIENFCTDRDDDIRQTDIPERLYDWKVPFYGSVNDGMNDDEETEARWIASRVPDIIEEVAMADDSEEKERSILLSIANALRYMHRDKLEPAFIKRYRKDYLVSVAVQNNLENLMDEDNEWDRLLAARNKVESLLDSVNSSADADETVGADAQKLIALQEELADAQKKLEETAKQESQVKADLSALAVAEDDDDDELFGDDGDDEVRADSHRFSRERGPCVDTCISCIG
jgi:hypothetical protein